MRWWVRVGRPLLDMGLSTGLGPLGHAPTPRHLCRQLAARRDSRARVRRPTPAAVALAAAAVAACSAGAGAFGPRQLLPCSRSPPQPPARPSAALFGRGGRAPLRSSPSSSTIRPPLLKPVMVPWATEPANMRSCARCRGSVSGDDCGRGRGTVGDGWGGGVVSGVRLAGRVGRYTQAARLLVVARGLASCAFRCKRLP